MLRLRQAGLLRRKAQIAKGEEFDERPDSMPSLLHIDPADKAPSRIPIVLGLVAIGLAIYSGYHVGNRRDVVHAILPNGVEVRVEQSFTWDFDLFNTSFLYRVPGGAWTSRYYSHEDGYWGDGKIQLDASNQTATILRDGKRTIDFNWATLSHIQWTETQSGNPVTFDVKQDSLSAKR